MNTVICFGRVMHLRLRPRRNLFSYRVFFLRIPLSRLQSIRNAVFSLNGWNLFSLYFRDYGARDGSPPEPWIRAVLERHDLNVADGEIVLQTFPRILGYVFNPVSFWLCHDRAGGLRAVLCEVNNTYGEHHNYLLSHPEGKVIENGDVLRSSKVFHVSPFCDVTGSYDFRFQSASDVCSVNINYDDGRGRLLLTTISGRARDYTPWALLRAFFMYPWMTFGVMVRIHWQALKLWLGGVRWLPKPLPPRQETTR